MPRCRRLRTACQGVTARAAVQLALHHQTTAVVGAVGAGRDLLNILTTLVQPVHRVRWVFHCRRSLSWRAHSHAHCLRQVRGFPRRLDARRRRVRARVYRRRGYRRGGGAHMRRRRRSQPLVTHRLVGGHAFLWIPPDGYEKWYRLE